MARKPFNPQYVQATTNAILRNKDSFEIAALSSVQGLMLQRIHNDRKATDGSSLGKYSSASWIAKRLQKGRQVGEKDLEFNGDLRRSVVIGKRGKYNAMGFDNDLSRLIAEGQQRQIQNIIYGVSDEEQKEMDAAFEAELEFQLNQVERRF